METSSSREHHEHRSLALLAGVAVDKGPETDNTPSSTQMLHHHNLYHHHHTCHNQHTDPSPKQYRVIKCIGQDERIVQEVPFNHHNQVQTPDKMVSN
jgi:hypothetical protein